MIVRRCGRDPANARVVTLERLVDRDRGVDAFLSTPSVDVPYASSNMADAAAFSPCP
jgi:hypothetical protein